MQTSRFVSGTSVILAGWLGATFLNEVPTQRYPKLDKKPATALADPESERSVLATTPLEAVVQPVSFSR